MLMQLNGGLQIGNVHLDGARDDDILVPIFTASFEEKGPAVGLEESGQPSPVSILDSPFHDEACTTPESSLAGSLNTPNIDWIHGKLLHLVRLLSAERVAPFLVCICDCMKKFPVGCVLCHLSRRQRPKPQRS